MRTGSKEHGPQQACKSMRSKSSGSAAYLPARGLGTV